MDRSLRASVHGLEVVKKALVLKGWTQEYLAGSAGCSRQTLGQFLSRKRIEKRIRMDPGKAFQGSRQRSIIKSVTD